MLNSAGYQWLRELSQYDNFQECISLSEKNIIEQYDVELALRFIIFSNINLDDYDRSSDVGEFITNQMITMFTDNMPNTQELETQFRTTFDLLQAAKSYNSFRRFTNNNHKGGFLLSPYEVIAYGLGNNYQNPPQQQAIIENIQNLYTNPNYIQFSGSGVRANTRLPNLIPLGREIFSA